MTIGDRRPRRTIRLRLTVLYGAIFLCSSAVLLTIIYVLSRNEQPISRSAGTPNVASTPGTGAGPNPGSAANPRSLTPQVRGFADAQHAHELHQLLAYSAIALAGMAVLSIGLGWLMAGRALRPIRTITDSARAISASNLHERLALSGPDDELKNLGDTIDELLDRLDAAFTAQSRFVANASHELRTPLTLVRALLQMTVADPDATVETFRSTCNEAIEANRQQERLIAALLVLARSERGLDRRATVRLDDLASNHLLTAAAEAHRRQVHIQAALSIAPIRGDAALADRLVSNLVDNAIRYNVASGRLDIATGTCGGEAFLRIANTGPLVHQEDAERIVEPFQRLDDSTTSQDGLGLGLSIVKAITNAHEGRLTISSRPGGGLEIEIRFPLQSPREESPRLVEQD